MSNPTIMFCPKEKVVALSELTGFFIMKPNGVKEGLINLNNGGTIIVPDEHILLMGWRAPINTQIVFVEGFPGPGTLERMQAEGRVWRYPKYPQDTPHRIRLKLDKRIHAQRMSLKNVWAIMNGHVRSRRTYYLSILKDVSDLCDRYGIPHGSSGGGTYTIYGRMKLLKEKFDGLVVLEGNQNESASEDNRKL